MQRLKVLFFPKPISEKKTNIILFSKPYGLSSLPGHTVLHCLKYCYVHGLYTQSK